MITTLLYLFTIIGIEISLLLEVDPGWGVFVYGLMLISLLIFAALDPERRPMLIGLSGIPIIRIVGYGIPFAYANLSVHLGITGLVLLFYIAHALRLPEFATAHILKLPHNWLIQISIILSGIVIGFCQFWAYPQVELSFNGSVDFVFFLAAIFLSAIVEEIVFRGIALTGFTKMYFPGISIVFVSIFYACLFIPFGSISLGLVMFLTSLYFGYAVLRLSGLYGVIGAHFISSLFYYLILPTI